MEGFNVLHPMGWDAFGEPAEQNAVKNNVTPREVTDRNTANYKRQMRLIGTSYDWDREIDSSDPAYYRWTQWMFLKMYKKGLAYRDTNWQWWCPTCATTLSSHEIEGDKCWRGHSGVTKKEIPAWYFKITAYADELINGLETVDWPEAVKRMQRNWIGRSEGVSIQFPVVCEQLEFDQKGIPLVTDNSQQICVFTTRPDTIYGVTFMALAPEHPLVSLLTTESQRAEVFSYIEKAIRQSEVERISEKNQITGVFIGGYVANPLNGDHVPVYVSDYVLLTYGTGAVMGVPAHDHRDFQFARKYGLEIRSVISPAENQRTTTEERAFVGHGVMVNSGPFDGLQSKTAVECISDYLEEAGRGCRTLNYRMRDWLISRQRYWGTPIPIIHCPVCGEIPVPESDLPVMLPKMEDFTPDGSGRSPLDRVPEFVHVNCPRCGGSAQRETDTMGGFACSSWYFLRFTSPHYHEGPFDVEAMEYWMPVDLYVGGTEHAVLHLLYARFWTKMLADEGLLPFREPFTRLVNQGQLHGPDGRRMSKSRGNVVTPDEIVAVYGADALRVYSLFMAPFEQSVDWNTDGINGARRFLNRVWQLFVSTWDEVTQHQESQTMAVHGLWTSDPELERVLHSTIQVVTERVATFRFNTMISALMEFVNVLYERIKADRWRTSVFQECLETLLIMLAPVAPYIAEELWTITGHDFSVHQQNWPKYNPEMTHVETIEIPVQINGKMRSTIGIDAQSTESKVLQNLLGKPDIQKYLEGQEITRVVYVPGKILNVITK
jgi:leucyl-tRNA synthetase